MMKVLWLCGLPNEVRLQGFHEVLSYGTTPAWSWILGHLPPPAGIDLHILCPVVGLKKDRIDFEYLGAKWHCFKRSPLRLIHRAIPYVIKVWRFVHALSPDVVHGWGGETGFGYAATLMSKRNVVSVQGLLLLLYCGLSAKFMEGMKSFRGRRMLWRERQTYDKANILLVESKASQDALKLYYGKESVLVHHPLRIDFLSSSLERRVELKGMPIKFVFVGSLVDRKGAKDALYAFTRANIRGAKLVYIGEGPKKDDLCRIIAERSMSEFVMLRGSLPPQKIAEEFATAQFFLLPSYGDTGPTALKEALACGLFPICYENSGPKDLIGHYGCGGVCETGDIDALAQLLKRKAACMEACIMEGQKTALRVREELGREAVWKELMQVYVEVTR